jgi:hypothetical protein
MSERRYLQVVTSDGKVLEGTCYHRTRDLPRIEVMQLDSREKLCLKLLRYICESLAAGTAHGATIAHTLAERQLGEADGSLLVGNITALLHAIRAERVRNFSFMPADCPVCSGYLCGEELAVLELLRAAQKSDGSALTDWACELVGDGMVVCVVLAASALSSQLDTLTPPADFYRPFRLPG